MLHVGESWYREQDSNLHGCPLEPKPSASTNSAIPAIGGMMSRTEHSASRMFFNPCLAGKFQ